MPPRSSADPTLSPWWGEFLAVKDGLSWSALAARFGVNGTQLQQALASVGLTKKALPPGRKPKALAVDEPYVAPAAEVPGPDDLLRRLAGKQPDGEVAAAAGVSVDDVKSFRRANSIAAYLRPPPGMSPPPPPTLAPVKPVLPSAGFVVRRTSAPGQPVQEVRRAIPTPEQPTAPTPTALPTAPSQPSARVDPLERFRNELGTVGDQVIADRAGVTRESVGKFRRDNGIPAYDGFRTGPRRKAVQVATVEAPAPPTPAPEAPSRQIPKSRSVVDAYAELLGTVPDGAVAAMAGVSRDAVKEYRKRHGIARFRTRPVDQPAPLPDTATPSLGAPELHSEPAPEPIATSVGLDVPVDAAGTPSPGMKRQRFSKIDAFADLVGVLPDRTVASRAGVTVGNVQAWRTRRGIPASRTPSRAVEPTSTATVEAAEIRPAEVVVPVVAGPSPEVPSPAAEPATPSVVAPALPPTPVPKAVPQSVEHEDGEIQGRVEPELPALTAYRLRAMRGPDAHEFYIIADDIGDAGVRAVASLSRRRDGPWRVVAVRELGEALD